MEGTILKDNQNARRYELIADGEVVGFAQYTVSGDTVTITHTEIDSAYEGKGYGSALAKQALSQIKANRQSLIPACQFIAGYIGKHQEYADLVAS